jgi:hypothetical protein
LDAANRRIALDRPFRYEQMWETHDEYFPMLEKVWASLGKAKTVQNTSEKLKAMASALSAWGKHTFGQVRSELRNLKKKLEELRSEPNCHGPSYEEIKVQNRIVELNFCEEIMCRQRSRIQWLAEGDGNTKFFHQKASTRKRKNRINELRREDGTLCQDNEQLGNMVINFCENLYYSEGTVGMEEVLSHIPCKVTNEMNGMLCAPYKAIEVKEALFQMYPTKAPGPDGFPAHFFQRNWGVCGDEVTEMVLHVLNGLDSPEVINKTFIVLIPKVQNPTSLTKFRPIVQCNFQDYF